MVSAGGVDAVLVRYDFPKFGSDLVSTLSALDVDKLTHGARERESWDFAVIMRTVKQRLEEAA